MFGERGQRGGKMAVKAYLVFQRCNLVQPGQPNERVIAVRLTSSAAQAIVDATPGTRFERHIANKDHELAQLLHG